MKGLAADSEEKRQTHKLSGVGKGKRSPYTRVMEEPTRDHGPQPFDVLMDRWKLTNHELVEASPEQVNHKQVQKARKGRQLTLHLMQKLTRALNIAIAARLTKPQQEQFVEYLHRHAFNYAKGYDTAWQDPNEALIKSL
ncbi:MAG: hypothetical protein WCH40_05650 [Verrucomicrobiales bacterium]